MGSCNPPGNAVSRDLNILLVGPRRTGKSSAGNTLLGRGQVFETRGGGDSSAASAIIAQRYVNVVDAKGWSSSEKFVPQEEKTELLRALSLCGPGGPHVVLLVIPLLDFTEPEQTAVEKRMEILTTTVWRHTMVLFTCGDRLRGRGHSVEEHIQSGGPALHWLMEKCRYRYHVFDNKVAVISKPERREQEVKGGEAQGTKRGELKQVTELLSKVENLLQENGGWHFSLNMYQRLKAEWIHREWELRAQLEAETNVGGVRRKQNTVVMKINMEPEQEQRLETDEEEEQDDSLRKEQENKEECVVRKMKREEDKEKRETVELQRLNSKEDGYNSGEEQEENTEVKTGIMALCRPNGGQCLAFSPIRRLA
ncbi:uncharacterized protein ABDE67_009182 [Symphorus nematophorus]